MSDPAIAQDYAARSARSCWPGDGILLAALAIIALPLIFRDTYWRTNLTICAINVLLALGLDFIIGYAGQLNLGHSAFYGLGAYVSTLLIVRLGVPFWARVRRRCCVFRPGGNVSFIIRGAPARPLSRDRFARFCGHHLSNLAELDKPDAGPAWYLRHSSTAAPCRCRVQLSLTFTTWLPFFIWCPAFTFHRLPAAQSSWCALRLAKR